MDSNPSIPAEAIDAPKAYQMEDFASDEELLRRLNECQSTQAINVDGWPPQEIACYFQEKLGTLLQQMRWVNHDRSGVKSRDFSLAFTHVEDGFLRLLRLERMLRSGATPKDM